MTTLSRDGRQIQLSYSSNVHAAESVDELLVVLKEHIAPASKTAFGAGRAAVNLRLGKRQADELLGHPVLPSTSTLSEQQLGAQPAPECQRLISVLDELDLDVVSINAFPIGAFHAQRVKEQVYSPPWTDGGRALYSLKIAKVLTHLMARPKILRRRAAISVPSGVFKGLYGDADEVHLQCAHFLTECIRELARLERLTGCTVVLGLEPEPLTTGETIEEFIRYYQQIIGEARQKYPLQLGLSGDQAEALTRRFLTINLDLCHQAVEFEDPLNDLKRLKAAGVAVSGLHLSAALKLAEPQHNPDALAQLKALDEPRYLHQLVARKHDGTLLRLADLPELWQPRGRGQALDLSKVAELRCHFHVPLFADLPGALSSTRETVGPAARFAWREGLTDNFVAETYTWGVLASLAASGNVGAQAVVGASGKIDVQAGIVRELSWAKAELEGRA